MTSCHPSPAQPGWSLALCASPEWETDATRVLCSRAGHRATGHAPRASLCLGESWWFLGMTAHGTSASATWRLEEPCLLFTFKASRSTHCCKSPGNTCGFVVTGLDTLRSRALCPQISGPHLASLSGHVVVPGVGVASSLAAPGSAHHGVAPVPPAPQRAGRCAPCPSTPWGSFCRGGAGGRAAPGPGGRFPPPRPPPPSGVCAVPWPQLLLCVPSVHVSLRGAHTFVTFFAS